MSISQVNLPGFDNGVVPTPIDSATPVKKSGKNKSVAYEPPNLGKAIRLPVPDFSDPNRKPTCLEVDFPIAAINSLAIPEATSPGVRRRPEYNAMKWFARRGQSSFRAMLIAAAVQAPDKAEDAAKIIWDHYYCNHQKAGTFKKLKVLEPFMGGGTTVVEGARLGFQVTGVDLNPVAWFVVKNEVACSDPAQVKEFFDHIDAEVKPLIQPFYTTTCPRGHIGQWIDVRTNKPAPSSMDPINLAPVDRKNYRWEGPEVIYTFWAKHGPCGGSQGKACGHRTPIFKSPIVAEKKLTAEFISLHCPSCGHQFNAELGETRMAPGAERIIVPNEPSFTELSQPFAQRLKDYPKGSTEEKRTRVDDLLAMVDKEPGLQCPRCNIFSGEPIKRVLQRHAKPSTRTSELKKKDFEIDSHRVYMYLLIHSKWLEGSPGADIQGNEYGGYAGSAPKATDAWYKARLDGLNLVEVRGRVKLADDASANELGATDEGTEDVAETEPDEEGDDIEADRKLFGPPAKITLHDGTVLNTHVGTVPTRSAFRCGECGTPQDILGAVAPTKRTAPVAPYALQCHCPTCDAEGYNYGGRFFKAPRDHDIECLTHSEDEWSNRCESDLQEYWPKSPLWPSYMTHKLNGGIPNWGYTHWWKMFNSRQLLVHTQILKTLMNASPQKWLLDVRECGLGAFQQYLRNMCMFAFWHRANDVPVPHLSNDNYHPKQTTLENNFAGILGYGNWSSCVRGLMDAVESVRQPWESVPIHGQSKAERVTPGDPVDPSFVDLRSASSTELFDLKDESFDLVMTDPPFGNNVFYGDLADFFYVWLRIPLLKWYEGTLQQAYFQPERTPRAVEAVQNSVEHPDDRDEWEREPIIESKCLAAIQQGAEDHLLKIGDANPLFRREPASEFYCKTLTACWTEANRILKAGGLMAFTFHHSEDDPWIDVLRSLFDAGFVLSATYPVRSDNTKGETAGFGSKKIEYDIIHVCRKRLEVPIAVSWAKMRRWVKDESARVKTLLERVHGKDLLEADLLVILRGKALEFYSRHYGQVLTGDGQILSVPDALLGINQLLDDLLAGEGVGSRRRPPEAAEPASRLMLTLFLDRDQMTRDELHKTLRGTGINPDELQSRGWIRVVGTKVHVKPIAERYTEFRIPGRTRKNMLKTDLDQAHFLIGMAMTVGGPAIPAELDTATFVLKRSVDAILEWYAQTAGNREVREAAALAARLVAAWRAQPRTLTEAQMTLFEKLEQEASA